MENIIAQWQAKTPEEQLKYLQACILKDIPLEIERGTVQWFIEYHGLEDLAAEAWLHIVEITPETLDKLNSKRETPITLGGIVWRAARHAIRTADSSDKKHHHDPLEWLLDDGREQGVYSSEEEIVYKVWVEEFTASRDDRDQQIIKGRLNGLKKCEIAEYIGISPVAISKRLNKMKNALMV